MLTICLLENASRYCLNTVKVPLFVADMTYFRWLLLQVSSSVYSSVLKKDFYILRSFISGLLFV